MDDEPDILNLAKMILEKKGYQVIVAPDGDVGLAKTKSESPDLVLLDVVMPGKSGLEVCKLVKSQSETKHIPVVIFTVLGRDIDRKLAVEAGAEGHFTKPFTTDSFLAEVKRHLDRVRESKFSKHLGLEHAAVHGKKILFEFDPSTAYERLVRDFAMECSCRNEKTLILTKKGSAIEQAVGGDEGLEVINITPPTTIISSVLGEHSEGALSLVYDSLSDLALCVDPQAAYRFAQNSLGLLSDSRITALFLLNTSAHEERDVYSLRGLFSSQLAYGKQGITMVRVS